LNIQRMTARESGVLARSMKRNYVEGASDNMQRAVARSMYANAHFLSRTKHAVEMMDAVNAATTRYKESRSLPSAADAALVSDVYPEMLARNRVYLTPPDNNSVAAAVADFANRTTTLWMLTSSVAYPIINAMQVAVFTAPYLMRQFSPVASVSALGKGEMDAVKIDFAPFLAAMDANWLSKFGGAERAMQAANRDMHAAISNAQHLTPGERAMLLRGLSMNQLNVSMIHDAMSAADPRGLAGTMMTSVSNAFSVIPHHVEAVNRISSALAAYRLQKEKLEKAGVSPDVADRRATDYAWEVVDKTHFNYSDLTGSRYMSPRNWSYGNAVRVLVQMKSFTMNSLFRVSRDAYVASLRNAIEARGPVTDEMRQEAIEARRFLAAQSAVLLALGGALSLPLISSLFDLIDSFRDLLNTLIGDWNEAPSDIKADLTELLSGPADPMGELTYRRRAAETVLRGPLAGMDITTLQPKLGLNALLPGSSDFTQGKDDLGPMGSLGYTAATSFPLATVLTKVATAKTLAKDGRWGDVLASGALTKGVGDVTKAVRGYTRSAAGYRNFGGEYDAVDRVVVALGFQRAEDARHYSRQGSEMTSQGALKDRLDTLSRRLNIAVDEYVMSDDDQDKLREAQERAADVLQFGEDNPHMMGDVGVALQSMTKLSVANEFRTRMPGLGGVNPNNDAALQSALDLTED